MTDRETKDATFRKAGDLVQARLSDKRYAHTIGVLETAERLAALHGIDEDRTRLAALLHDSARELGKDELLRLAQQWDLPVSEQEMSSPILLHGPVAAEISRRELGIENGEVLEALRVHTTGAPGMGPVALALFVADAIEPGRSYPSVDRLRELAEEDLREAAAEALRRDVAHDEERGREPHPASLKTLRWLETMLDEASKGRI